MTGRLKNEAGYSLIEVMASIVILSIAIIPMVGMFDVGLRSATEGSNYDRARALANASMENIKILPYNKSSTPTEDSVVERFSPGADRACPVSVPSELTCAVRTRYTNRTLTTFQDSPRTNQMEIVVKTGWNGQEKIKTTGLVSGGKS